MLRWNIVFIRLSFIVCRPLYFFLNSLTRETGHRWAGGLFLKKEWMAWSKSRSIRDSTWLFDFFFDRENRFEASIIRPRFDVVSREREREREREKNGGKSREECASLFWTLGAVLERKSGGRSRESNLMGERIFDDLQGGRGNFCNLDSKNKKILLEFLTFRFLESSVKR